jgi:antitoxin VapB
MDTAQLSTNGTQQIIILPPHIHLDGQELYIKQSGNTLTLIPQNDPWQTFRNSLDQFSDDFMTNREQPPLEHRAAL